MAYNQIKTLLNKKGWTGRELGIIEITNMCSVFTQRMQGIDPPIPIVTKAQFQGMLNSLQDSYQGRIYNGYISIHEWISLYYNIANSNEQQAQLQFKSITDILKFALMAEDVYDYTSRLPVIMTPKQYEEAVAEGRKRLLDPEDGYNKENIFQLILRGFEYYAKLLDETPSKQNPLKPLRKKYLAEPISSPFIKARYNEVAERGYWITPDGKRSDQMSEEAWQEAITTQKMRDTLRRADQEEEDSGRSPTIEGIAETKAMKRAKILYQGGEFRDWYDAEKQWLQEEGLAMPVTFVEYDDLPEDLNKWDFLKEIFHVWGCYTAIFEEAEPSQEDFIKEAQDFVAEFADLVKIMLQDITQRLYDGKPVFEDLPLEKWLQPIISLEEMYERDLYGYRADIDRPELLFDGNQKALFNGIAIIDPNSAYTPIRSIDDQGYYHTPEIHQSFMTQSLEAFFVESEHYAENVDALERGREALLDSYYFLKAYNTALDMIAAYYEIPDIVCFKANVAALEAKIQSINDFIPLLYARINDIHYEDERLKERKLQVLQDIFTEFDYKSLEIPPEKIEQVRDLFEDFRAFKESDIADILFYREASSEEVGDDE